MSRFYEMQVEIKGHRSEREKEILAAIDAEWTFEDHNIETSATAIRVHGCDFLYGGESELQFAKRLTHSVWSANGEYCAVEVRATNLEELPHHAFLEDEDDYEEWKEHQS